MSQQCALAAQKGQWYPGLHQKRGGQQAEVIIPLYFVLVRPYVEHCTQAGGPQYRKDVELLERVQRRAMKMIRGLEHNLYEDRLRELSLFSLEKRRLWEGLIAAFQHLKGAYKQEGN